MLFSKGTGGLGDQRKFIRITRRVITYLYRIQSGTKRYVPHLTCVKKKFHNKRNDMEPGYKSKSRAIFVDFPLADDRRFDLKHKHISSSLKLDTHICV